MNEHEPQLDANERARIVAALELGYLETRDGRLHAAYEKACWSEQRPCIILIPSLMAAWHAANDVEMRWNTAPGDCLTPAGFAQAALAAALAHAISSAPDKRIERPESWRAAHNGLWCVTHLPLQAARTLARAWVLAATHRAPITDLRILAEDEPDWRDKPGDGREGERVNG